MPRRLFLCGLIALLALECQPPGVRAESALTREVRFDQRLGNPIPLDTEFLDEAGAPVQLQQYFAGKPVVLVMSYFRCPRLCTEVLNDLTKALRGIPYTAGRDYQVVVISFDAREKPDLAAAKKQAYVESYGRPGADNGWHFLTGDQPAIDRVCEAIGFKAVYDPKDDQFAHASGITIVTPKGVVSRYLFGLGFSGRDMRLALVDSSAGKVGSLADQILLYCFHYDPATGKYSTTVLNLVRAGGVLTVLSLVGFWVVSWRKSARRRAGFAMVG